MGKITVSQAVYDAVEQGKIGKGDVLGVATTAGIMGAKRTAELIPMCHILPITNCRVRFEMVPEERAVVLLVYRQGDGEDRGGDGGADGGSHRGADGVRHVQGGTAGHGDYGSAPA